MNTTCSTAYGDFEWDNAKNAANRKKNGISFELAIEAFADADGVYIGIKNTASGKSAYACWGKLVGLLSCLSSSRNGAPYESFPRDVQQKDR